MFIQVHTNLLCESVWNDSVSAFHNVGHAATQVGRMCMCVALQSLRKPKPKALARTTRAAAEGIWEYTTRRLKIQNLGRSGEDRVRS